MVEIYKRNKAFLIPYLFFLFAGTPLIILFPKGDIHVFINHYNYGFADVFFKYLTFLGSGLTPLLIGFLLLLYSIREAILIASAATFAGILAQILKLFVFPDVARPLGYFKGSLELHLIEGVEMHHSYSFPSGHSSTIFALCFSLAIITRNNFLKAFLFIIAVLVGFSRVYLSQHFLNDVLAGSFIGILSTIIIHSLIHRIKAGWVDLPLIEAIRSSKAKA